jgi:S1-C subfamily serine protease
MGQIQRTGGFVADRENEGGALGALSNTLAAAVERAGRAVVAVSARQRIPSSGVHWRAGIVVAAEHTIKRDDDITIALGDGRTSPATLVGRDPSTDLAVLRFDHVGSAAVAEIGDPAALQVGHLVLAVGRPGEAVTASFGAISALGGEWRSWRGGRIDRFIRLDLSIYDGFSGGALVDAAGRVVGVNSSGLARGMAVAVPASTVTRVVEQLLSGGRVARGFLGVALQPVRLPASLVRELGLEGDGGAIVLGVESGGPGDSAGLLIGDVIVEFGGMRIREISDMMGLLGPEHVNTRLRARIVRGGASRDVEVLVAERTGKTP